MAGLLSKLFPGSQNIGNAFPGGTHAGSGHGRIDPRVQPYVRDGLEGFRKNPGMFDPYSGPNFSGMQEPMTSAHPYGTIEARPMNPARSGLEHFIKNPGMFDSPEVPNFGGFNEPLSKTYPNARYDALSKVAKPNVTGGMDYASAMSRPNIGRQVGKASTYGVPGSTGNAVSGMSMSKLGGMAKNFGRSIMPGSGRTVAQAFGKQSLGKKAGGFLSKAGALPGWSMPAAAAIGWQVNKRAGQKAHQKDLTAYYDKVKNTPTELQHTIGPKPEHNRQAGFLGRMFKR